MEALLGSDGAALAKLALLTQYGVPAEHRGPFWTEVISTFKASAGLRDDEVLTFGFSRSCPVLLSLKAPGRFAALRGVLVTGRLCR